MAVESTRTLTEMSTRDLPGDKGRPARKADNLTAICEPNCLEKIWEPQRLTTLWSSTAYYRDGLRFYLSFPCQFSFHRLLHTHHLSSGAGIIDQLVADVPGGLSVTPVQESKKKKSWDAHNWVAGFEFQARIVMGTLLFAMKFIPGLGRA
jgi:hypothetical protein